MWTRQHLRLYRGRRILSILPSVRGTQVLGLSKVSKGQGLLSLTETLSTTLADWYPHRLPIIINNSEVASHTWYRMQGCAVHRNIKNVGWEPRWWRLNSEKHQSRAPNQVVVSPLWRGPGNIQSYRQG